VDESVKQVWNRERETNRTSWLENPPIFVPTPCLQMHGMAHDSWRGHSCGCMDEVGPIPVHRYVLY